MRELTYVERLNNMVDEVGVATILEELSYCCQAKARMKVSTIMKARWMLASNELAKLALGLRKNA